MGKPSHIMASIMLSNRNSWLVLFAFLLLEYFAFRTYVLREVINFYPPVYDQTSYLNQAYELYEKISRSGFRQAFDKSLFSSPTSFIFPIQGALFFLLADASRLAALSINFFYFAILQIFAFKAVYSLTKRYDLGFLLIGFILALNTPFFWAGGLVDFRIDFAAACLYGIFLTAVINSKIFFDRKWTVIATFVAVFLVLTRYITAIYLSGIFLLLLLSFVFTFLIKNDSADSANLKKRIFNLFLSGSIGIILITPFLWLARHALYHYYVVGHLTGIEKYIRAKEFGNGNLFAYPLSLLNDHLGKFAVSLFLGILLLSVMLFLIKKIKKIILVTPQINMEHIGYTVHFLLLAIFVPMCTLTLGTSRSPVVINIITIPICWLTFLIFLFFLNKNILNRASAIMISLFIFALGFSHFLINFSKHNPFYFRERNMQVVTQMYETIGDYFHELNLLEINHAADQTIDYLTPALLNIIPYENNGYFFNVKKTSLSTSIFTIDPPTAEKALAESHVYITNINNNYSASPYPFNEAMKTIHPQLMNIAEQQFITLGDYHFDHYHFRAYVKPDIYIKHFISNDNNTGLFIHIPAIVAKGAKEIILQGEFDAIPSKDSRIDIQILNSKDFDNTQKITWKITEKHYEILILLSGSQKDIPIQILIKPESHQKAAMHLPTTRRIELN